LGVKLGCTNLILWSGQAKDKESPDAIIKSWTEKIEEMEIGVVVNFPHRVMLARKPL
jgi:hypothetical protein